MSAEGGFFAEDNARRGLPEFIASVDVALQQATTLMGKVTNSDDQAHLAFQLTTQFLRAGRSVLLVLDEGDKSRDVDAAEEETLVNG